MRKLLLTLMSLCFLAGIALAGLMPPQLAHAAVVAAEQGKDCDHHTPREPSGPAKMDCCAAGYCSMLVQGLLPDVAPHFAMTRSVLHPMALAVQFGLPSAPTLRPPRSLV